MPFTFSNMLTNILRDYVLDIDEENIILFNSNKKLLIIIILKFFSFIVLG